MVDWRGDPSTKKQHKLMDKLGITYSADISKGVASDLISMELPATDWQVEQLKFFRVKGAAQRTQYEAAGELEELFADEANKAKWDDRRCSKEQKDILEFFNLPMRKGLRHREAEKLIGILFKNDSYSERWQEHEDSQVEREMWFEDTREFVNDMAVDYDCKKLSKRNFAEVVASLEARGMELDEIEGDYDAIFSEALLQYPELGRQRR